MVLATHEFDRFDQHEAPVRLLLVHAPDTPPGELHNSLRSIAARYAPMVVLEVTTEIPARFGRLPARRGVPMVLVIRDGDVVGEAMGDLLPTRELDRVVRCALEWPHEQAV